VATADGSIAAEAGIVATAVAVAGGIVGALAEGGIVAIC
jgi:hypothetical protein